MRALTLHGCHAHDVAHGGKDVENRSWHPPEKHIGTRIAIHAGSNSGDGTRGKWPKSCIVATATLAGYVDDEGYFDAIDAAAAAAAIASRWYGGPVGWILTDVRALATPIACKGALGLWEVPADKLEQLEQLEQLE